MRWRKRCIHTHIYVHVYIKCTSDISFPREYFCRKKKRAREKNMTRYRITCVISAYRCNHSDRIVADEHLVCTASLISPACDVDEREWMRFERSEGTARGCTSEEEALNILSISALTVQPEGRLHRIKGTRWALYARIPGIGFRNCEIRNRADTSASAFLQRPGLFA